MTKVWERLASVAVRGSRRLRGDYTSGINTSPVYEQFLLESGTFPRHVEGQAHVNRIRQDVEDYINLANGMDVQVILDIGALNGIESRILATAFPEARVFTFEPVAESASEVRQITKGLNNVTVHQVAVSNFVGFSTFYVTRNRGTSSLRKPLNVGPTRRARYRKVRVETITIEEWARATGIDRVDLVWMDVQGSEDLVLEGFGDELLSTVQLLKTEMGVSAYYENHAQQKVLADLLAKAGMSLVHTASETPWEVDVIWKRM